MQQANVALEGLTEPTELRNFQRDFGQYLRSQIHTDMDNQRRIHVSNRVGKLYQTLIFNNIQSFINQCFPVCQTLMSEASWQALSLHFFQNSELHSPYFTEVNQHFVDYLYAMSDTQKIELNVPDFLADLAHYEWIELRLDIYPNKQSEVALYPSIVKDANHIEQVGYATLNTNLANLHYPWAVHQISSDYQPNISEDTFIIVYRVFRDNAHRIEFMQVNALTHMLIDFIQSRLDDMPLNHLTNPCLFESPSELLTDFLHDLGVADEQKEQMISFGVDLLQQLVNQQVMVWHHSV